MTRLLRNAKRTRTLRPVRANAGTEAAYRAALQRLIDEMAGSVEYWLTSGYRNNEPRMAQDATPADVLQRVVRQLRKRWTQRFDTMATKLADHFAQAAEKRSTTALRKILKDAGWTIEFKMTPAQRDVVDAVVHENVALIKSIPAKYLDNVEGLVMRAVARGGDLGQLTKQLQAQHGVSKRRASLIARDQNNKAFSMLNRARQRELGIEQAIWVHSSAGKHPRPAHVKMDGKTYDVKKGMWDSTEQKYVLPGELINCRCFSRSIIPGL